MSSVQTPVNIDTSTFTTLWEAVCPNTAVAVANRWHGNIERCENCRAINPNFSPAPIANPASILPEPPIPTAPLVPQSSLPQIHASQSSIRSSQFGPLLSQQPFQPVGYTMSGIRPHGGVGSSIYIGVNARTEANNRIAAHIAQIYPASIGDPYPHANPPSLAS